MIGLLIKDFHVLKKQMRLSILIIVFYMIFSICTGNASMVAYMILLFGLFIPITAIGYDERCEWNKYAACMPIKRSELAISKYLLSIIAMTIGVVLYFVIDCLITQGYTLDVIQKGLALLSAGLFIISIYLPITFKVGVEKSRFFLIALFMIPTLILLLLEKSGVNITPTDDQIQLVLNFAPVAAAVITIISILLSIHIIKNKEF